MPKSMGMRSRYAKPGRRSRAIAWSFAAALAGAGLAVSGWAVAAPQLELPKLTTRAAEIPAGTYDIDPAHTHVLFRISHFGISEYVGRFDKVSGTLQADPAHPENSKLEVVVQAASVDTTSPDLNEHLRGKDFFNAQQFPEIRFVSTEVRPTGDNTGTVTGQLTMLGVTKPVTLQATFRGGGMNPLSKKFTIGFSARGEIKRSDFGMKAYLPVVGDQVALELEAEMRLGGGPTTKP